MRLNYGDGTKDAEGWGERGRANVKDTGNEGASESRRGECEVINF